MTAIASPYYRLAGPQVIHELVAGEVVIINLATGAYYVRATVLSGAIPTTGQQGVLLTQGARQVVEFGQYQPEAVYLPLVILRKSGRWRLAH
jgi:hypothetical protein